MSAARKRSVRSYLVVWVGVSILFPAAILLLGGVLRVRDAPVIVAIVIVLCTFVWMGFLIRDGQRGWKAKQLDQENAQTGGRSQADLQKLGQRGEIDAEISEGGQAGPHRVWLDRLTSSAMQRLYLMCASVSAAMLVIFFLLASELPEYNGLKIFASIFLVFVVVYTALAVATILIRYRRRRRPR